ncbi:UNVERIFIED_CONTAM: hypothetical protein K2H54_040583 [Gekko kuhli]
MEPEAVQVVPKELLQGMSHVVQVLGSMLKPPLPEGNLLERAIEAHAPETGAHGFEVQMTSNLYKNLANVAPEIKECVDACNFIKESTKDQNADSAEMENWVLIGQMIDKLCFWAAILLFTIGTLAIFLMGYLNVVPDDPFPE